MAFNRNLAKELIRKADRDVAPHFAGRTREISEFNEALIASRENAGACIFRIFQGAPGCGKTSLVNHLKKIREEDCFFVSIAQRDLEDIENLHSKILRELSTNESQIMRFGTLSVELVTELVKMRKTGERLSEQLRGEVREKIVASKHLVLHMDEAQTIAPEAHRVLLDLHTTGLSFPCLVLFTGLNHTYDAISGLDGMSRLGGNVAIYMGPMANEDCATCTKAMLEELRVVGNASDREDAAMKVAAMSYGWPQHLKVANDALCSELLRADGVLKDVDFKQVQDESQRRRADYYQKRLTKSVLEVDDWKFTYYVVNAIGTNKPKTEGGVHEIAHTVLEKFKFANYAARQGYPDSTPSDFADALIRRGVVSKTRDGIFAVSIPSFATWLRDSTAERRRNDRQEIVPDLGR